MEAKRNRPAAVLSVVAVTARLVDQRLRVDAVVYGADGRRMSARVPDRELAALLPRSILAADGHPAPQLLNAIRAIVERTVVGRRVRVWEYGGERYLAFLSWRTVCFNGAPTAASGTAANGSARRRLRSAKSRTNPGSGH